MVIFMVGEVQNEPSFEQLMARLRALGESDEAFAYADAYITPRIGSFPIIEGNTAHFVYKTSSHAANESIGVIGEWNNWSPRNAPMTPIGGGLLHYERDFEPDARLNYLFAYLVEHNMHSLRDPLNARIGRSGMGDNSELAMPAYLRPRVTIRDESVPQGKLVQGIIKSKALHQQRPYTVYLPYDYSEQDVLYPSVYFHDGNDYLTMGEATTILDNLIHQGSLPPLVAVFVSPIDREREYNCSDVFTSFFCDELVPELHQRYSLDTTPASRCVIGPSLGGLISLYMASRRSDTFGLVCAQSTVTNSVNGLDKYNAFRTFTAGPHLPLRLAFVIGSYERSFHIDSQGRNLDLFTPVRELRAVLDEHNYPCYYREEHQGHSWGLWRDTLGDALVYLFEEQ